jgi:8-oxo-dGTP pyrophosphatase MutT (NUDIX family)
MGDGDGWVICGRGHRHWGRYGAAGLLITDGTRSVLQHRSPWTHNGDTWGVPGGARDSHEDAVEAALREAHEEAALDPDSVVPIGLLVDDHGGWSYTTIVARPIAALHPYAASAESVEIRWCDDDEIAALPLHPGFALTWPQLRDVPRRLTVLVAMAGIADPDELPDRLRALAQLGIAAADLPASIDAAGLSVLLPRIVLLTDEAGGPRVQHDCAGWWARALTVQPVRPLAPGRVPDSDEQLLTVGLELGYGTQVSLEQLRPGP